MPFTLEIVSPEKLLFSREVEMAVIPAAEGELGVLEKHAPMIVLLRGGTVRVHEGGQVRESLFVSGGFAEITPDRCTVLADEAVPADALDRGAAERRLDDAQKEYNEADRMDVPALDAALERMQSARAMAEAAGG